MSNSTSKIPKNKSLLLTKAILDCCAQNDVRPQEILYVLGEAVIRLLIATSDFLGYDKKEIVKVFAEGLASAEIEYKEKS